jgi:tetratricopeptide (TPR) repeat protein
MSGMPCAGLDAVKNCFHKDSITNREGKANIQWYWDTSEVNFTFTPYSCELSAPNDFDVFVYDDFSDTVYYSETGGAGVRGTEISGTESYGKITDSLNINIRKHNYAAAEEQAKTLLQYYPDSTESISAVSKLYLSGLRLDSSGNKIGQIKSFLENLISQNGNNYGLVRRAFYFIQKCKVKLGQYQSALDGFQLIMLQNPYSYEGLVASWDYSAVYLLMGSGGAESNVTATEPEEMNQSSDTLISKTINRLVKSETRNTDVRITKPEKSIEIVKYYEKIKTIVKDDRQYQEEKLKRYEEISETGKDDRQRSKARTELEKMKVLKETVKPKKPETVQSHIKIINNDLRKIFGTGKSEKPMVQKTEIPTSYELRQNYPNPFNSSSNDQVQMFNFK